VTFYQATAPTAEAVGDLWVDTDDSNHTYRWSGSAWESARDLTISIAQSTADAAQADAAQALADAATAQATADGKIQSFYQAAAPLSGMAEGDLWIDTDDGNTLYVYQSGS